MLAKVANGHKTWTVPQKERELEIKLNWLRAAVLGANDGIVSVAGVVMGVAATGAQPQTVLIAGVAAVVAGAISMGGGEYVSVSAQRDSELAHGRTAALARAVMGLAAPPPQPQTVPIAGDAPVVAGALSMGGGEYVSVSAQRDSELAHGRTAAQVNARPWAAAWSSFVAFSAGAILPLIAITGPWESIRIPLTVIAVITALGFTGWWAAWAGKASIPKSIFRNISISVLTMGFSYLIGSLLGVAIL